MTNVPPKRPSPLASESAAIVKSMDVIERGSRESSFGVSDLNQMAGALSHESALLNQELGRFSLPTPRLGGSLTTSTILWQDITFDPIYTTAAALGFMAKAVHAKLVSYGEGAELRPELAERWEVLEGGRHYRFHLRRDARFHNGRPVEAKDVYESFLRLLLPQNKSSSSWIMRNVTGAEDVLAGKSRSLPGVVVRDEHTVDIHLEEPLAFFVALLSMHECGIIPIEETRDPERFRLRAVGAGPYRVEEVSEGKRVRLTRNPEYFVSGQPLLDELTFRLDLRSTREVADAFLRGELDIAHGIPLPVVKEIRTDPRFAPESRDWLRDRYYEIGRQVDARIGEIFSTIPRTRLEIRAVEPFRERNEAGGSYQDGTPDGSRPGVFYYNAYDLPSRRTYGMETLYLHEGAPGHHFQISLANENEDLPNFMRFGGNTAFVEGWALYAETLWDELGMETDPYQRFGGLNDEMLRAMRLVVDTGIHAKGWTREQAIRYMLDNSGMSETEATSEVERYIAIPGQALAYKIGQLKILELRERAEQALGDRFDLKEFHAQVLMTGALPLTVLEQKIDDWIASRRTG